MSKIHLYNAEDGYKYGSELTNACGKGVCNNIVFEDFIKLPQEQQCQRCLNTKYYNDQKAEYERNNPISEKEFRDMYEVKPLTEEDIPFGDVVDNYKNTPDKYKLTIKNRNGQSIVCDIYDLIESLDLKNSAIEHGFKKICNPGGRGSKGFEQDMKEAMQSFEVGILIEENKDRK